MIHAIKGKFYELDLYKKFMSNNNFFIVNKKKKLSEIE